MLGETLPADWTGPYAIASRVVPADDPRYSDLDGPVDGAWRTVPTGDSAAKKFFPELQRWVEVTAAPDVSLLPLIEAKEAEVSGYWGRRRSLPHAIRATYAMVPLRLLARWATTGWAPVHASAGWPRARLRAGEQR